MELRAFLNDAKRRKGHIPPGTISRVAQGMYNLSPGVRMMVLVVSALHCFFPILDSQSFWVEKSRSGHLLGIPMCFRLGGYIEKKDTLPSLAVAVSHYSTRCQISCFWGTSMCP